MTNTEQRLTALEKLLFETDQYRNSGGELPYKVYTALLYSVDGLTDPTVIVLENTLNRTPEWVRIDLGYYKTICTDCFTNNKTILSFNGYMSPFDGGSTVSIETMTEDEIYFFIPDGLIAAGNVNGSIKFQIEIRVYP